MVPQFHVREGGDIHLLLAVAYLKLGRREDAFLELNKMVKYDTEETPKFVFGQKLKTPLMSNIDYKFFYNNVDFRKDLSVKLNNDALDQIRDTREFKNLLSEAGLELHVTNG